MRIIFEIIERKKNNYNNWIYVLKNENDNIWSCKLNEIKDEKRKKEWRKNK